jgi:hypothetical protein
MPAEIASAKGMILPQSRTVQVLARAILLPPRMTPSMEWALLPPLGLERAMMRLAWLHLVRPALGTPGEVAPEATDKK